MLINPTFQELIPALSSEEFAQLETNILKNGIREPLVVLYDGEPVDCGDCHDSVAFTYNNEEAGDPRLYDCDSCGYTYPDFPMLVDGHNRYEIAQKHGLEYELEPIEFEDEDAACVWIIDNQLGRRNLSLYVQGELRIARGKFSQLKKQAKENQAVYSGNQYEDGLFQNSEKVQTSVNTTKELADELKTSTDTASRIIQIQAKANKQLRYES